MNVNTVKENITGNLVTQFEQLQTQLTSFSKLRREAIDSFARQGLPDKKHEEYKYTPADKLFSAETKAAIEFETIDEAVLRKAIVEIPELKANRLVLVNGSFSAALSNIHTKNNKTVVSSLKQAIEQNTELVEKHLAKYADVQADAFIALNTAFFTDGLFLYVPDGVVEETPFHIINIITIEEDVVYNPRHLFIAGKNSSVKLLKTTLYIDEINAGVMNVLTEIVVSDNARLEYYKIQDVKGKVVNTTQVYQGKKSYFNTNSIMLGADWLRNNLNIVLDDEYSESHLNGLFITKGNQHIDNHTLVDHRKPNCQSNQLYKGILNDKSIGVFNGKIFVRKDAQKTNAYQSSKNILLSDHATINTKPQLEIYADDVKCSHGSSTGHIDPEALFYLQSRGLSVDSAKKLLMTAFAIDVINTIPIEAFKSYVTDIVTKQLE